MEERLPFLFDEAAIRWLQDVFGTDQPLPFHLLSQLGDTWGILLAIGIGLWVYKGVIEPGPNGRTGRNPAYAIAVAATAAAPVWLAMATFFSVDRPAANGFVVFEQLEAGGFPSGHVFHAMVAWGVLSALTRFPAWAAALAGLATGLGRLYLGVHFPADVLASLLLGPLFAWLVVRGWRRLTNPRSPPPDWARAAGLLLLALFLFGLTAALLGPLDPGRLRRWEIVGMAYGGPVAILLHRGWSRTARARLTGHLPAVLGIGGLTALAAASRTLGQERIWIGAIATALALLWIFVAVPALVGASETRRARQVEDGARTSHGGGS